MPVLHVVGTGTYEKMLPLIKFQKYHNFQLFAVHLVKMAEFVRRPTPVNVLLVIKGTYAKMVNVFSYFYLRHGQFIQLCLMLRKGHIFGPRSNDYQELVNISKSILCFGVFESFL